MKWKNWKNIVTRLAVGTDLRVPDKLITTQDIQEHWISMDGVTSYYPIICPKWCCLCDLCNWLLLEKIANLIFNELKKDEMKSI